MIQPHIRACWEVMECDRGDDCPARIHPARMCWEIARDYDCRCCAAHIFCHDCIVYLLGNEKQQFSEEELSALAGRRVVCTCLLAGL